MKYSKILYFISEHLKNRQKIFQDKVLNYQKLDEDMDTALRKSNIKFLINYYRNK